MLLLLVVGEGLPDGVAEEEGVFSVEGHAVTEALGVLVEGELSWLQSAVQVVPGPGGGRQRSRIKHTAARTIL